MPNLLASFAEFEQQITKGRLANARAHQRQGRRVAGAIPNGYQADPGTKQLIVDQVNRRELVSCSVGPPSTTVPTGKRIL